MTTLDVNDMPVELPATRRRPFEALRALFAELVRRRTHRLALIELSRFDAHLLRDIGINPMDVRDAYDGRPGSILFDPFRSTDPL